MPVLKNSRHELFAQECAKGASGPTAYLAAGYDVSGPVASASASRLLSDVKVSARIKEIQNVGAARAVRKVELTREWVLERLMRHASACLGDEKVKVARVVKSRKKTKGGAFKDVVSTVEVEVTQRDPASANRALELLGRERGMFVERKEVGEPGDFTDLSDDELRDKIRGAAETGRGRSGRGRASSAPDKAKIVN